MKQEQMTEILVLVKRIGNLFHDITDISMQLADAIDRRDEVSMEMIIAMRADPIAKLGVADSALRQHLDSIEDGDEAGRIRAILNGDAAMAQNDQEKILAEQAGANIRSHRKLVELDEILNRKITQEKSIYHT